MTIGPEQLKGIAADWRNARYVYPLFLGIAQRFGLEIKPNKDLESPVDRSEPEVLAGIRQWLAQADESIQVHQLRQFLQTSPLSNEASLRALITRYLDKQVRNDSDRDKLDFLLVQYFSQCAPSSMLNRDLSMQEVAQVMEPVLGKTTGAGPGWLEPLEDGLRRVRNCRRIRDLLRNGVLYEIRKLKKGADEMYFTPIALVAVTRCNYLLRQAFFRLMRSDLEFIQQGLRALEAHGIREINCRPAQLSSKEPVSHLLELTQQWKKLFQAEYSAGHTFEQLGEIRAAVEVALYQAGISIQVVPMPSSAAAAPASMPRAVGAAAPPSVPPQPPPAILYTAPVRASAAPAAGGGATAAAAAPAQTPSAAAAPGIGEDLLDIEILPVERREPQKPASPQVSSAPAALAPTGQEATPQSSPPSVPPTALAGDIHNILRQLAQYVTAEAKRNPNASATIVMGNARLVLSSWEVKAFTEGLGEFSQPTQEAVAVRVLLFQTLEAAKRGGAVKKLTQVVSRAHDEAARLQETIAESRDARNIEAAVTLSATSQRLLQQIEDAEVFLSRSH